MVSTNVCTKWNNYASGLSLSSSGLGKFIHGVHQQLQVLVYQIYTSGGYNTVMNGHAGYANTSKANNGL